MKSGTDEGLPPGHGVPYDRGWSWMVVLGIAMMHMFLIGYVKTFGLLFVELQDLFDLTSQQTAWVSTAMLLTIDILSPLGTALGDRFGSRVVVMVGGMLVTLSLVLSSLLINIQYIVGIMGVLFGVGATLVYAPSMIMVGFYFKRRLGLANALAVTGSSVGQFVLPLVVTLLLRHFSFSGTLLILAGIMFNLTLAGALLRPVSFYGEHVSDLLTDDSSTEQDTSIDERLIETHHQKTFKQPPQNDHLYKQIDNGENGLNYRSPAKNRLQVQEALQYASSMDLHCSMNIPTSKNLVKKLHKRKSCMGFVRSIFDISLLKNPVYFTFAVGCTCVNFSYIGTFRYLPAHCKDMGLDEQPRAMLLSLVGLTDLVARLLIGLVADTKFIRERFKRYRLLALSLIILAGNGIFLVYADRFWHVALSCAVYGVSGGIYMTLMSVSLVDLLGAQHLSRAWGIMLLLYGITTIGEPLILGQLRDSTGTYGSSFLTCAALFLAGGLLVLIAPTLKRCSPEKR